MSATVHSGLVRAFSNKNFSEDKMLARASSCVGNSWCHAMFKIKYCHKIFDMDEVRGYVCEMLILISSLYNMPVRKIGFGDNHLHFRVDIKLRSKPEAAKIIKGIIAKKVFEKFPEIKEKYFWGSGFWNPSYLMDNIGSDLEVIDNYISSQKYVIN